MFIPASSLMDANLVRGSQTHPPHHVTSLTDFLDIRTCSLELTLFPDVDVLCAFSDKGNLSLYPSHMRCGTSFNEAHNNAPWPAS